MKIRTVSAVALGALLFSCAGVCGWLYYSKHFSLPGPPFSQSDRKPRQPAVGAIVLAAPPNAAQPAAPNQPPSPEPAGPPQPTFSLPWDTHEDFRREVAKNLVGELGSSFPDLETTLNDGGGHANNPVFLHATLRLLDAYNAAPADKKPALLLAADLAAAQNMWCDRVPVPGSPDQMKSTCPETEASLAKYAIALHYDELGGGFSYRRDLLWRVMQNYPDSPSGEQAFVLLLEDGWDPSGTCKNGGDQTREVIRHGDEFLQKYPTSPYRGVVTYLVAEAYASWWSLSKLGSDPGLADYLDPKQFEDGADAARIKAIEYFDKVPALARGTKFEKYAGLAIESLRDKKVLKDPRFFCVYD